MAGVLSSKMSQPTFSPVMSQDDMSGNILEKLMKTLVTVAARQTVTYNTATATSDHIFPPNIILRLTLAI